MRDERQSLKLYFLSHGTKVAKKKSTGTTVEIPESQYVFTGGAFCLIITRPVSIGNDAEQVVVPAIIVINNIVTDVVLRPVFLLIC